MANSYVLAQLILFTYFCTAGSPFGIESAVQAAGPMYTIAGY